MIFNTGIFLLFFLVCMILYWLLNGYSTLQLRNGLLLIASYVFYGYWDWRFLILIIASSCVDFVIGKQLNTGQKLGNKRILLITSIVFNLGLLGFFKYFNFFADGFENLLNMVGFQPSFTTLNIILPVGISFYTFQTMSYTIDVFRGDIKAERNWLSFFTFVAFFPQLVAGPIERAGHMLPQFNRRHSLGANDLKYGLRFIFWGLFKKVVIADNFAMLADGLFDLNGTYNVWSVLLGVICFSIQIYCDFSGYSDMALGLARLLGFEISLNFRTPYLATSFREFWHRWHITLSTWFRDYVYIPLGGNRQKHLRNLMITFALSGLWHGAKITFVIWGCVHGIWLIAEYLFGKRKYQFNRYLVLMLVVLSWIPFRAESMSHMISMISGLTAFGPTSLVTEIVAEFGELRLLALGLCTSFFWWFETIIGKKDVAQVLSNRKRKWSFTLFLLISFLILGVYDVEPHFIYFQF